MKITFTKVVVIILVYLCVSNIYASEINNKKLLKNPFVKPANFNLDANNPADNELLADKNALELRATLVSSNDSIANINGEMVIVGQMINGYKLVSVDVGAAILMRNGKEKILMVNEIYKNLR